LLRPHRSYLNLVKPLLPGGRIKGMAHITGGGITENLPRTLPAGRSFLLDRKSWAVPPLFHWLQRAGVVPEAEMFRTFNMGVGFVLVVPPAGADSVVTELTGAGETAWVLGDVAAGEGRVRLV
jgi:phosphoribosylformylglycinamidine cyclo-ligase